MITPEQLVNREVHYCVSSLVSTLAAHWGGLDLARDTSGLADMIEQAGELACPVEDYESAATEAGWTAAAADPEYFNIGKAGEPMLTVHAVSWQALCEDHDIEPHDREVYEHWLVSDWLADKLAEHGEKVDKDFAGMTVWARTTTGQGIASDSVIIAITNELVTPVDRGTTRMRELQDERDSYVLGAPDGTETPDPEGWACEYPEDADELAELENRFGAE